MEYQAGKLNLQLFVVAIRVAPTLPFFHKQPFCLYHAELRMLLVIYKVSGVSMTRVVDAKIKSMFCEKWEAQNGVILGALLLLASC